MISSQDHAMRRWAYVILEHIAYSVTSHSLHQERIMRIGVNIPGDLYQRLKPLKEAVNISQVCREAIEAYVDDYERALTRTEVDGVDEVVDGFLRDEAQSEADWEELGWVDAASWVGAVDLATFEHLFHRLDVLKRQGRPSWEVPPPGAGGVQTFVERSWEYRDLFERQHERQFELNLEGDPRSDAERKYMRAWVAYVTAVREKIRQRREEKAGQLLKERREASEPEAPEHLVADVTDPTPHTTATVAENPKRR